MTPQELKISAAVASLYALRLIGLFMVLPLLSLYAGELPGATPSLIGIAVGCYGLTQALFQIPFGALSDRFNRKVIIAIGISLFIIGSLIAGQATTIKTLILGRALQGVGAVGSSTLALLTDYTRENQRTKAMAIVGISIGLSFMLALMIGPLLSQWLSIANLFTLAACLGGICLLILYRLPAPAAVRAIASDKLLQQLLKLIKEPALITLNTGIFILHAIFTGCFVVLPIILRQQFALTANQQWQIYLPCLLLSGMLILPLLRNSHQQAQSAKLMSAMQLALSAALLLLWQAQHSLWYLGVGLCVFFAAFNFLEAALPAQISLAAPADSKGSAMGIYSCSQFLGISVGGMLGGWLYGHINPSAVFIFCGMLAFIWSILSFLISRSN